MNDYTFKHDDKGFSYISPPLYTVSIHFNEKYVDENEEEYLKVKLKFKSECDTKGDCEIYSYIKYNDASKLISDINLQIPIPKGVLRKKEVM